MAHLGPSRGPCSTHRFQFISSPASLVGKLPQGVHSPAPAVPSSRLPATGRCLHPFRGQTPLLAGGLQPLQVQDCQQGPVGGGHMGTTSSCYIGMPSEWGARNQIHLQEAEIAIRTVLHGVIVIAGVSWCLLRASCCSKHFACTKPSKSTHLYERGTTTTFL